MPIAFVEQEDWVATELGAAEVGDVRRTERFLTLPHQLAAQPGASLPEACHQPGALKAA
jgi:hypothetical protein